MTTTATYEIDGVEVDVPMRVERAVGAVAAFTGDADAIAETLPRDLRPLRLPGGLGIVLLLSVRYLENPLGDYDEVVVGLAARPRSAPLVSRRHGAWIEHMAVSQPFTREAGETIWGYPKTLDEIELDLDGNHLRTTWARDGEEILHWSATRGGRLPAPPIPTTTYTQIDGVTMRTGLRARVGGAGVRLGGAAVRLGTHPIADQLRALGLHGRPIAAAWLGDVRMDFTTARPIGRSTA